MKVIITGAQFGNKGAQSLLFNVVDCLKKKYVDVDIYFLTLDGNRIPDEKNYKFHTVYGIYFYKKYFSSVLNRVYLILIENMKRVLKKKFYTLNDTKNIKGIFENADLLIDVSGYALSSKWEINSNKQFLNSFIEAKKHNIKTIILPQSFGPFDYAQDSTEMNRLIKNTLKDVDLIFAREQEGYDLLISQYGLKNVLLSTDVVIQNKSINLSNIYRKVPDIKQITLKVKENNVCLIPNNQTIKHGNSEDIIDLYQKIIARLQKYKKNIYIFNHANDMELCSYIYNSIPDKTGVYLIRDELNSFEYEKFVSQFDYIICSRYHGIVHAFKACVPAIILGWAIKYKELAKNFDQDRYIFDITNANDDKKSDIIAAIDEMNSNFRKESLVIKSRLDVIQTNTCFNLCWKVVDK